MAGQGAARRANIRRAKEKKELKKAAKRDAKSTDTLAIPDIHEDDLLAFQISHFGDNARPDTWFVDAETAFEYDPELEDDGLGYYDDGMKRTLTDDQIEMFRHSEIEQLIREGQLERKEDPANDAQLDDDDAGGEDDARSVSIVSDNSSMEDELVGLAQPSSRLQSKAAAHRLHSPAGSRGNLRWTDNRTSMHEDQVPYDQRHKRKWEDYIEENDPLEGSLTHRRIIRELDVQHEESIELDY